MRYLTCVALMAPLLAPSTLLGQSGLDWRGCPPGETRRVIEWAGESLAPRLDSMIRGISERLKRFRGPPVWEWTADSIDLRAELRTDSVALVHALAALATNPSLSDHNTGFLSALLYRRVSGAPGPLFEAAHVSGGERRAELALALRTPVDSAVESIVAGFVCDASRQLWDLHGPGADYWRDRRTPGFYWTARFEVMTGWRVLTPRMRARLRPFVEAGLPDEFDQLFGEDP